MANPHADTKYIKALVNNNTELLSEIYTRFAGRIKIMVLQNAGSETDAADIMQDALIAVYYKAVTGNFVLTCPFEAFLYTICKNLWLMQLRKKSRQPVTNNGDAQYDTGTDGIKKCLIRACKYKVTGNCFIINSYKRILHNIGCICF